MSATNSGHNLRGSPQSTSWVIGAPRQPKRYLTGERETGALPAPPRSAGAFGAIRGGWLPFVEVASACAGAGGRRGMWPAHPVAREGVCHGVRTLLAKTRRSQHSRSACPLLARLPKDRHTCLSANALQPNALQPKRAQQRCRGWREAGQSEERYLVTSIVARSRQQAEGARGGAERLGEN
jgi:hypothetical protein